VVPGARQRDTAGIAGGRSPGVPCAVAAAPKGLRPKDAAKLPPRNGENPGGTQAAYGGSPWPLIPSRLLASVPRCSRPGRQARRAGGAPLMIVKKFSQHRYVGCRIGRGASAAATRASRISPRSSGWSGRRRCPTHRQESPFDERKRPLSWEPPIGIEPMTFALRGGREPSTGIQAVTSILLARLLVPQVSGPVRGRC
jgi:hypothetical protein